MTVHTRNNQNFSTQHVEPVKDINNIGSDTIIKETPKPIEENNKIIWVTVTCYIAMHLGAFYGVYLGFTSAKLATLLLAFVIYILAMFGTTAGAHRLWSHRAFKATWQLKSILVFCHTLTYEHSIIHWARDHRTHHKYSETDADPHNAKRGFLFSHNGWLLCTKHQEVKEKGKTIDITDLYAEPLLRFQDKHYTVLMLTFCFVMPHVIPMLLWNETFLNAYLVNIARYIIGIHFVSLINSAAHLWGTKPYDKHINPGENLIVSLLASGEGWHNYHHTFPWDYKAAEFGRINLTTKLLNFFAMIGWAYDLKTVSKEYIKSRVERTGDGTHGVWGWANKEQSWKDYKHAVHNAKIE